MAKIKRYLTEQENELLNQLRALSNGKISQEAIDAAISVAQDSQEPDTALYYLGNKSVAEFMAETFGSSSEDVIADEPTQMIMVDFVQQEVTR